MNQEKQKYYEQLLRESFESCSQALDNIKSEESFSPEDKVFFLKSISDKMNLEKKNISRILHLIEYISNIPDRELPKEITVDKIDSMRIKFFKISDLSLMIDMSIILDY